MTSSKSYPRWVILSLALLLSLGLAAGVRPEASWSDAPMESDGLAASPDVDISFQFSGTVAPDGAATSELAAYSEYFSMESHPESVPVGFDLSSQEPAYLYFGEQRVSYPQYRSLITGGANTLWIGGASAWAQYTMCPLGASVTLVATTPTGGWGTMYEIYPSGRTEKSSYLFNPYSHIYFYADEPGQHILLFVVNNRPSNAVIVDVTSGGWWPGPIPGPAPVPGPGSTGGMAKVTVMTDWLKGYDVKVDGFRAYNDLDDGALDGVISFTVTGNQNHKIEISKGGYYYMQSKFFAAGRAYTIVLHV